MLARTFLLAGVVSISLMSTGCATDSAPAVDESAVPTMADQAANAQYVGPALAQQPKVLTPQPSEVRWIGPGAVSADGNIVVSTPTPTPARPAPSTDQPVALNTTHQVVPAALGIDQTIPKPDKPSIKADPQPMPTDTAKVAAKLAGDSGNSTAQPAPVVVPKPANIPTATTVAPATINADDVVRESQESRDKAGKIASTMVDPNGSRPLVATPVLPATQPASPPAAAESRNTFAEAAKWLPGQPTKVVSFESVLAHLPTDAQPLAQIGWDEFSVDKTHRWLKEQLADVNLHVAVEIVDVKLTPIPDARDPGQTAGWELTLTTRPERFRAFGLDSFHWPATWKEDVSGKMWRGGEVRLPVTEDFAKQARLWRAGDTVVLSGAVGDVFVEGGTTNLGQPCGRFTTIFHDVHIDRIEPQISRP
jgi:hypothetical protein